MSGDPSLSLQAAVIAALKNDSGFTTLVGQRLYDRPPENPTFPYVVYGEDHVIQADFDDCNIGWEVFTPLHVWSRKVGQPEVKRIGGSIHDVLHLNELNVSGFRLVLIEHHDTRYLRDPDGLTSHAVVEFRSLIDA